MTLYVPVTTTRKSQAAAALAEALVKEYGGVTVIGKPDPCTVAGFWLDEKTGAYEQDNVVVIVVLCIEKSIEMALAAFRDYGREAGEKAIAWDAVSNEGFVARIEDVRGEAAHGL